jgi:hypothetical protein
MTLPDPTVLVTITPESLQISRTDRQTSYDTIGLNFATLSKEGYMGTCNKLGDITMRMLADAHRQIFASYPALVPPTAASDPAALALGLMNLSLEHNTRDYVQAIDTLLRRHAETVAHTGLAMRWNVVRQRLMDILG